MQFGIFFSSSTSPSDPTTDSRRARARADRRDRPPPQKIAPQTEEVGMDVCAIGEHHNPPFFAARRPRCSPTRGLRQRCSSPRPRRLITTKTRGVRSAEDKRCSTPVPKGRMDLMLGRPYGAGPRPVVRGPGQSGRASCRSRWINYNLCTGLGEDVVDPWNGKFRGSLEGFNSIPASRSTTCVPCLARLYSYSGDRLAGRFLRDCFFRQQHLLAEGALHAADPFSTGSVYAPLTTATHRESGDSRRPRLQAYHRQETPGCQKKSGPYFTRPPFYGTARP